MRQPAEPSRAGQSVLTMWPRRLAVGRQPWYRADARPRPGTASRRRQPVRPPLGGEAGSGTAIGVAIIFPMLLLVIVVLHAITLATRSEQALQAIADRAAHTASLCCLRVDDAEATVREAVGAHARGLPTDRLECSNDVAADTLVEFRDVSFAVVPSPDAPDPDAVVPSGGRVAVRVTCELPRRQLAMPFLSPAAGSRTAIGIATVDPYRHRSPQAPGP